MSSVIIAGNTSGTITLDAPNVAGTTVLTLPTANGTVLTTANTFGAGTGPAFSAYASATTAVAQGTSAKIAFATEVFDTNNNFASSRFTPTVAGYYQINACITFPSFTNTSTGEIIAVIYKNGIDYAYGSNFSVASTNHYIMSNVSTVVYFNGTTDYVEIYAYQSTGSSLNVVNDAKFTYFSGAMIRSA
jgi:hypothetical protein